MNDIAVRISGFSSDKHAREFAKWLEEAGLEYSREYLANRGLKYQPVDKNETYPLSYDSDGNVVVVLGPEETAPKATQPTTAAQLPKKYVPTPTGGGASAATGCDEEE